MRNLLTIGILCAFSLNGCGQSRSTQCEALTSVKAPLASSSSTPKDLLLVQKAYLEGYKGLSLSDPDLKQAQADRIAYYEQSVKVSKEAIELSEEIGGGVPTASQLQQVITQSGRNLEVWSQLTPLLSKTAQLCPNSAPR